MFHRSLAVFSAVMVMWAGLSGCAPFEALPAEKARRGAVELFDNGDLDDHGIDRRASWFGQCTLQTLYLTPPISCSLAFTFCLEPRLRGACQMFMWFWCGDTMVYRGDISHTHTGYRMLFIGSPVRDYVEMPLFAIFSENELPLPVSPVTLLYDRVMFGGMCYVLRPPNGQLPPEFQIPPRESL